MIQAAIRQAEEEPIAALLVTTTAPPVVVWAPGRRQRVQEPFRNRLLLVGDLIAGWWLAFGERKPYVAKPAGEDQSNGHALQLQRGNARG